MLDDTPLDFCDILWHSRFAILRIHDKEHINKEKAQLIHNKFKRFYKKRNFVLITDRIHNYSLDTDVITNFTTKRLCAWGVVSSRQGAEERARYEQQFFEKSFAFFTNIDDATQWAKTF